jgi:hypothetical protein
MQGLAGSVHPRVADACAQQLHGDPADARHSFAATPFRFP